MDAVGFVQQKIARIANLRSYSHFSSRKEPYLALFIEFADVENCHQQRVGNPVHRLSKTGCI
jgi:hypothetical protein